METIYDLIEKITSIAARRPDDELLLKIRRSLPKLNKENPDLASRLSRIVSNIGGIGALRRFNSLGEDPKDTDSGLELMTRLEVPTDTKPPILAADTQKMISRFVQERENHIELQNAGISAPSSLALIGKPGTGKTSLAYWLAARLELPLFNLNIASVVTSYLGQTGQNLKRALDRAKIEPCLLLLDEFDALGYQRENGFDVGEMRRVVAVLLQEVESWPEDSIVVAATNLPEQLDSAFKRRFSRWIELTIPDFNLKTDILSFYYGDKKKNNDLFKMIASGLPDASGADLKSLIQKIKSREILEKLSLNEAVCDELEREMKGRTFSKEEVAQFVKNAYKAAPKHFTYRKMASILGVSHTTISNYTK